MPRSTRSPKLENRTSRLKLSIRKKPYGATIAPGVILLYRRNQGPGTWAARLTDGKDRVVKLGAADDHDEANGREVLDFWQAQHRAREKAREYEGSAGPITVGKALEDYEADLTTRGADLANVKRARAALSPEMLVRNVSSVTATEWKRWRDRLAKTVAAATVNRTATCLKAALNLSADHDERITRRAWETGLATIPGAEQSRNVILSPELVTVIVTEARELHRDPNIVNLKGDDRVKAEEETVRWAEAFGLFVEVIAVSGARPSQAARLNIHDLPADGDPRLMMPSSKKGRGEKKVLRRPIPISAALAMRLRAFAAGKAGPAPLLPKPSGERWAKSDHSRPFARTIARLKALKSPKHIADEIARVEADGDSITIYALRHSNIVRQLKANVPIRITAASHDTSVAMIERNYSAFITDHTDEISRAAMLEIAAPQTNNVISLRG